MSTEKQVSYHATNTYSVLNKFSGHTKNVWLVCHGIGYLSRYFIRHFQHLDPEENYVISPQAQAKYYLSNKYTHVGASWLTNENTEAEIENVLNYLDAVYEAENLKDAPNLIILGYSQGVSVATRWLARRKIKCDQLLLHSGKVPKEIKAEDFEFRKDLKVSFIYGSKDEYLKNGIVEIEEARLKKIFPKLEIRTYDGGHELNKEIISDIAGD